MPVFTPERERVSTPPGPRAPAPRRRNRWRAVAAAGVAVVLVLGVGRLTDLLPSLGNPFTTESVDRTQPAVLRALEDLSRYHAATGQFQVIVDLQEDARFLPDFIRGERTLFVASGTVDAWVDFSGLGEGAITVSPDGESVHVSLPSARLSDPRIDPKASRVVSRDRGLLDRLGSVFSDNPTGERQLYLLAERKLAAAAKDGGVTQRAEENTRAMLETMLRALGFSTVGVTFAPPTP
ncbi:MAG: DUF4230 domain-containing protein [Actinomycetota bacterium]|nr:DUF4230 domain-containing protein [Actinomycetota bacterium]